MEGSRTGPGRPPAAEKPGKGKVGRLGKLAGLLTRLALTALVTWFILRAVGLNLQDFRSLDLSTIRPRWGLLLLSCGVLLVAYLFSASLWGLMVRELGGPAVGGRAALRVFFTANLGRYLPGKVWQLAGMAYLARREGVTAATATTAALLGQAFSLAGAALVGLGVLLGHGWGGGGAFQDSVAMGFLVFLVVLVVPPVLRPILRTLVTRVVGSLPAPSWPDRAFGVRWLGLYALGWIAQGGAFWVLARGLGQEMPVVLGITVFPASYLLGYLAIFAPAGVGIREGFLIAFLNPILGAGGAILAVAARLWTLLAELVPALALAGAYLRTPAGGNGGGEGHG